MKFLAAVLSFWTLVSALYAQVPALTHLNPVAGQQGTTVTVSAAGKLGKWPPKVWVDAPGIEFKPAAAAPKFDVQIAQDAPPGAHLVRFFNEAGASEPRLFVVSAKPETLEAEPNDRLNSAQAVSAFPATISGRLDKADDVDSYAVTLRKGQTLTTWAEGYVLASAFDGLLRIVDQRGTQHAFNHDSATLDPSLTWTAPVDGTYLVQIMGFAYPATADVRFTGGEGCVYRLHFEEGPPRRRNGVDSAEEKSAGAVQRASLSMAPPDTNGPVVQKPGAQGLAVITEAPRADTTAAQALTVPSVVDGQITTTNEEDRYSFSATKGRTYDLRIRARAVGSALDAWVKLLEASGKQLSRVDDVNGSPDPSTAWTAPVDGTFTVVLGDVTHRGSSEHFYHLSITEAVPQVQGTALVSSIAVAPGKGGELKVKCQRRFGHSAKLQLLVKNLPPGVTATPVEVGPKDAEVTLKFAVDTGATPAQQPFQLVLQETESQQEVPVVYSLLSSTSNNGVSGGYSKLLRSEVADLWITVLASK